MIDERVRLLMNAMTIEEKVAQMIQISFSLVSPDKADEWARKGAGSFLHILGDDSRRVQKFATETRLGIPVIFGIDAIHGHAIHNGATVFPTQLALASSWNPELAEKVGRVTAREVSAEGLHWTFSPVLCLGRDLRWGRINETFGEDPYLAGKMGAGIIKGYQGTDVRSKDSIAACAKHYIAYGESRGGRDSCEASVTMRGIRSTFLPPFAEAVKASCLTFMAGYQSIDGVPMSANKKMLRDVLKDELGFDGFVVTDWSNVGNLLNRQFVVSNITEASSLALDAGNDMIMTTPEFYEAALSLPGAHAMIDDAVRRILSVKFRIGLFDMPEKVKTMSLADDPSSKESDAVYNCEAHQKINLEAAQKSIVLLKNNTVGELPALPIRGKGGKSNAVREDTQDSAYTSVRGASDSTNESAHAFSRSSSDSTRDHEQTDARDSCAPRTVRTIAVIGPNADSVRAQFGDWTFFTHPKPKLDSVPAFRVTTMLDGIKAFAEKEGISVLYDKGCDIMDKTKESIMSACEIAGKADIVFIAVGDTIIQNGEAHDRADLTLTGKQNDLVYALRLICDKKNIPLVSILVNGKPLDFSDVVNNSDAILETFNSGTLGGEAVAGIIFGAVNPQGRLPISFPRTTGQLPVYYNQTPDWHDGKYFDCESSPLFAFGEGLSYSAFRYNSVRLSKDTASAGETVDVLVSVTNTSGRDGVETVQLYANDLVASVARPVRELKGFSQIQITAGATVTVCIPLAVDSLSLVNADEKTVLEAGDFEILAGHDSRKESLLAVVLTVV